MHVKLVPENRNGLAGFRLGLVSNPQVLSIEELDPVDYESGLNLPHCEFCAKNRQNKKGVD